MSPEGGTQAPERGETLRGVWGEGRQGLEGRLEPPFSAETQHVPGEGFQPLISGVEQEFEGSWKGLEGSFSDTPRTLLGGWSIGLGDDDAALKQVVHCVYESLLANTLAALVLGKR